MVDLTEYQFELGGVVFGHDTDVWVADVQGLGSGVKRTMEQPQPLADGIVFGREYVDGAPLVFEGNIVKPGMPGWAFNKNEDLTEAWSGDATRFTPRAVEALRIRRPLGDTRIVFGRPERYDADTKQSVIGLIPWSAVFRPAHRGFFSDTLSGLTLALQSSSSGGLVTDEDGNIPSPIVTVAGTHRTSFVTNEGRADAWPVVTVHGPVTDPAVSLLDDNGGTVWWLEYEGSLAFDQDLTFDTQPWSRGVWLGDGTPVGGKLSRRSRLAVASIPPGTWEARVDGTDITGTASFDVAWRDGYRSI